MNDTQKGTPWLSTPQSFDRNTVNSVLTACGDHSASYRMGTGG